MTPDLHTLAAAAVQSPHWRWMPGVAWIARRPAPLEDVAGRIDRSSPYPGAVPDLQDPATLGCLLALVREAWGDPSVCVTTMLYSQRWRCHVHDPGPSRTPRWFDATTEPAALITALLAAPKKVDGRS